MLVALLLPAAAWATGPVPESYLSAGHWIAVGATGLLVMATVVIHFEGLTVLTLLLPRLHSRRRSRILILMLSLLGLHVLEIWLFGLGYFLLLKLDGLGALQGVAMTGLPDYVYFSAVSYSSLGFGDLLPTGPIRFLAGTEAITGLLMIAWSGSFTFIEMQRFWRQY